MRAVTGFPVLVQRMIRVGEEGGTLDAQLEYLVEAYNQRLGRLIGTFGESLKPGLILVAAGLFIFLIVALLLPIYDIMQSSVVAGR